MPQRLVGYALEPEELEKLRMIASRLQGGNDRERDEGHRLSLIVTSAWNRSIYDEVPS